MFTKDTLVAWATKKNTFMGRILESNKNTSVVIVTSTAKGKKYDGKKMIVHNEFLADMSTGKGATYRM